MVWPPSLMACSVTEDSSLAVAASHLSADFASGAFASLSGAWAASGAACANHKQIPAANRCRLFFMRLFSFDELGLVLRSLACEIVSLWEIRVKVDSVLLNRNSARA